MNHDSNHAVTLDAARRAIFRSFGLSFSESDAVYVNPGGEWEVPDRGEPAIVLRRATEHELQVVAKLEELYALLDIADPANQNKTC